MKAKDSMPTRSKLKKTQDDEDKKKDGRDDRNKDGRDEKTDPIELNVIKKKGRMINLMD